jgi:uncharacterized NAD(P)/FAD-binding protein YdhS
LAEAAGSDWRAVFDLLRHQTSELWKQLDPRQRRRFIRHLRAYWDVHRHRAAPAVHQKIMELQKQGVLRIIRGRTAPGSPESFDRVFDCTGLTTDLRQARSPLVRSLLEGGWVEMDDPPIGFHSRTEGLYVLGPLLRGQLWESVAVPEIRIQAHDIAAKLR